MKLSKKQFCIAVDTFKEMMEEENDLINALDISPEWKPGHWINNYYELLEEVCELEVDDLYGSDLDWFCFETDFGRKKDYCKVYDKQTNRTWTIETPDVLYDFITREW